MAQPTPSQTDDTTTAEPAWTPRYRARVEQLLRGGPARFTFVSDDIFDGLLHRWIREVLGYDIPQVAVCSCHDAPFQVIADSFFGRVQKTLSFANRTGGKTLGLGLLYVAQLILQGPIDIGHVGAKKKQAKRCFRYVGKGLNDAGYTKKNGRITQQAAAIDGGGEYHLENGSEIEVLTGSIAGVNSPHPNVASFDEIELTTEEILDEAKSMPVSKNGRAATEHRASTRKYANGIMQRALDNAAAEDRRVYSWCAFEVAEQCVEADCSVCEAYVSHDRHGKPHTFREVCDGKMRRSRGWMSRHDIIHMQFVGRAFETFASQWAPCDRPESVGQYYSHFQRRIHCLDDTPGLTDWRPEFAIEMGMPPAIGIDFGVADPNAFVVALPMGPPTEPWKTAILVDGLEDHDGDTTIKTWPEAWKLACNYGDPDRLLIAGDSSGRGRANAAKSLNVIRQVLEAYGVKINSTPRDKSLKRRHDIIENRLRVRSDGEPRLYVWTATPGGRRIAQCLESLRRPLKDGVPVGEEFVHDENSHTATAVEFLFLWIDDVLKRGPAV